MNNDSNNAPSRWINLMPHSNPCYDFQENNNRSKKSICLVPHVIKYKQESEVITWRCNWGNSCESECLYAMANEKRRLLREQV
jgi:hypothetical protein